MTVELALSPDGRWEFSTAELARESAAAGFSAVGIPTGRADHAAAESYRRAGVRCHEVLAVLVGDDEAQTLPAAEAAASAAATMGAEWVLTVFRAAPGPALDRVVRRCAETFSGAGTGMAAEFSPLGPVSGLASATEVVASAADRCRAGVMIDSWHFCNGPDSWSDLATFPLDLIAYVQFADALRPDGRSVAAQTMHRRAVPGEGVLDLGRFAGSLLDRGWDGLVSVEVLNHDLRSLPAIELLPRLHRAATRYWR